MDEQTLKAAARDLLTSCLADPDQPDYGALERILNAATSPSEETARLAAGILIRDVVEEISDRFDPALAGAYVEIFSRAIARAVPTFSDGYLRDRYARLKGAPATGVAGTAGHAGGGPRTILVLSRITLGADIAVTSVFMDALVRRFPNAQIVFVGPAKNAELFREMPGLINWPLLYPRRGTLLERFGVADQLTGSFDAGDCLLMDPDSRITQLGLLPVAPLQNCLYFDSRCLEPGSEASLSEIASTWCETHLGVPDARPAIFPGQSKLETNCLGALADGPKPICISLGVGNNERKRISMRFEARLLEELHGSGLPLVIDAGAGGAEAKSVREAVAEAHLDESRVTILGGSFADFCSVISYSQLYVGYDSAGQHAAAALGIPTLTLFKGFANERMFQRWQPRGFSARVIRVEDVNDEDDIFYATKQALHELIR